MANTSSAATMTLGEFVTEAALFPHSKERFEIVKECNEFELMAMCLDNTEFVTESYDLDPELIDGLAILTESANFNEAFDIKEKMTQKRTSIWSKIVKGWNAAIGAIVTVIGKVINFFTGRKKKLDNGTLALGPGASNPKEILAKIKKADDAEKANIYKNVIAVLANMPAAGVGNHSPYGYYINSSNSGVAKKILHLLESAGIAAGASELTQLQRDAFVAYLVLQGDENEIRLPKFALEVLKIGQTLEATMGKLSSDIFDTHNDAQLNEVNRTLRETTKRLRRLAPGGQAPSIDNMGYASMLCTRDELTEYHEGMIAVQKQLKNLPSMFNVSITTTDNADKKSVGSQQAMAISNLNKSLADFQVLYTSYSGIVVKAFAEAITTVNHLDQMHTRIMTALTNYTVPENKNAIRGAKVPEDAKKKK